MTVYHASLHQFSDHASGAFLSALKQYCSGSLFCIEAVLLGICPTLHCLYLHAGGAYGAQRRSCHLLT
jgi:hypothetical protein